MSRQSTLVKMLLVLAAAVAVMAGMTMGPALAQPDGKDSGSYPVHVDWCDGSNTELLAEIWSTAGVTQPPTQPSTVTFPTDVRIKAIMTYHYNYGATVPGTMTLEGPGGTVYGPWTASGSTAAVDPAQHWCTYPDLFVPAGTYTVVDSVPSSWSQVSGPGMLKIFGTEATSPYPAHQDWCDGSQTRLLSEIWSTHAVTQPPNEPSQVTFPTKVHIKSIMNYHYNYGTTTPGTMTLRSAGGDTYGPWNASGSTAGIDPARHWCTYPDIVVPAGTYTVEDSVPSTWSQVFGPGMLKVFGDQSDAPPTPPTPTPSPTTSPVPSPTTSPAPSPTPPPSPTPSPTPNKVTGVQVKSGSGKVTVAWKPAKGQVSGYQVQVSQNKRKWKKAGTAGPQAKKFVWKKGKRGKRYYLRVAAFSDNGRGPWSKPVSVKVK